MTTPAATITSPAPARSAPRRRRRAKGKPHPAIWIGVFFAAVFSLVPVYWLINTSLKTGDELSSDDLVVHHPSLSNFTSVLRDGDFLAALRNSVVVSVSTTALALVFAAFAAYALARLQMRAKFIILAIVLSVTTFPGIAIAAPVFMLWSKIGLYNTIVGLIIPYLTFALPLAIYTLVSFFKEIPAELEEAAYIDGAAPFQAFYRVILPLAAPGIATVAIITFIFAWNEFLLAATLTYSNSARTAPVAIAFFTGSDEFVQPLGTISTAAVIISIPIVVLVLVFQRRIISGLTSGAVKG